MDGYTPLHFVAKIGHLGAAEKLIENGADISAKANDNKTPFEIASEGNHTEVASFLSKKQSEYNRSLLNAVEKGDISEITDLLDRGADANAKDDRGRTLLQQLAAKNGSLKVIEKLIEKGANVNGKGINGDTPLHFAARNGHLEVLQKLMQQGADISARNMEGMTPLDLANLVGKSEIVSFLGQGEIRRNERTIQNQYSQEEDNSPSISTGTRNRRSIAKEDKGSSQNFSTSYSKGKSTSGATRPSSWINDFFSWAKEKSGELISNVVNGLYGDTAKELEGYKSGNIRTGSKESKKMSSATMLNISHSGKSSVHGISKENVSNKGWSSSRRKVEGSTSFGAALPKGASGTASSISQVYAQPDITGLMLLVPIFMNTMGRKFVLPLLSADQPISPEKAQLYALNITNGFKEVLEQQAELKGGIGVHRFKIDFVKMQEEVTGKIMVGKFNEISGILKSYAEKGCPSREAGCSGRLSQKKYDKFMTEFNSIIDLVINQSMQQMLSRLEISDVKEQEVSLKPKSYLNGTSVQGHLTQDRVLRNQGGDLIPYLFDFIHRKAGNLSYNIYRDTGLE